MRVDALEEVVSCRDCRALGSRVTAMLMSAPALAEEDRTLTKLVRVLRRSAHALDGEPGDGRATSDATWASARRRPRPSAMLAPIRIDIADVGPIARCREDLSTRSRRPSSM
jgi:hypothetical protein